MQFSILNVYEFFIHAAMLELCEKVFSNVLRNKSDRLFHLIPYVMRQWIILILGTKDLLEPMHLKLISIYNKS
jgi:hypothetical protein